jgi:predicted CXXCH cytochrome family protein
VQAKGRKGLMLARTHDPFVRGNCTACHTATGAATLKSKVPDLCFECHDDARPDFERAHKHAPLQKEGSCLTCHGPHGAPGADLLVRSGDRLCMTCHDAKPFQRKVRHAALDQGCVHCHDSHSAAEPKLLKENTAKLCRSCHTDLSKHFHKPESAKPDPRTERPMTCSSCHDPHSAELPKLMLYSPDRELCIQCHDPSMAPPGDH